MRILVAEDDLALSLYLKKSLEMEGHDVKCAADGFAAAELMRTEEPELVVLDLGLPKMDGVDVLRQVHGSALGMSVIILTGRSEVSYKIECFNLGADDYLVKPFSLYELLARCRAVARRRVQGASGVLRHGDLQINRMTREVTHANRSVVLTAKEFTLLEYLLLQRGRAVPRQELLREVWRMAPDAGTNVVDVYVNYLRRKLGFAAGVSPIETVRGEGYAIGMKSAMVNPATSVPALPAYSAGAA